jgi:glutathione-regulated potassium-efflux system ancillary protein KefG
MSSKKILILFFHPRFEDSKVNAKLVEGVKQLNGVTFRDMYELYPDFNINIKAEQAFLLEHDIIIWHHPFYWYNCPPLMKQWLDLVLEYGWAYGSNGKMLSGKWVMNVISSGGNFNVYQADGKNRFTHRAFLNSFEQTAQLCQMVYLPPFIVAGANKLLPNDIEEYMIQYAQILHFLMHEPVDIDKLAAVDHFNQINAEQWERQFYKMP